MLEQIKQQFRDATDLFTDTLDNGFWQMEIAYFPALCDEHIKDGLLVPFSYRFDPDEFRRMLHANPKYAKANKPEGWASLLLKGFVLIRIGDECYSFKSDRTLVTEPDTTKMEASLEGPQSAFTESLDLNLYLLRFRYNVPTLTVEPYEKGSYSNTAIQVVYDRKLVNRAVLEMLYEQMDKIKIDLLLSSGQMVKELTGKSHRLFPTLLQTERPDRVASMLRKGKIAILINGSRFAIILPVRLYDFMHAMDDDYDSFWMSRFLIGMRYIAVFFTIVLPAAYIAIVSYNPEIFRVQLAFTIDGSRAGVPYPSFIEVFIMLFMIEALIEASIRLPRFVGSTATTVGGLILGQAAQQAGLVSSIMIIITSVVAISNFVIPNSAFSQSVRLLKYLFVVIAMIYGISGVAVLFFAMIVYLCNLRSFGEPYFALFTPRTKDLASQSQQTR
ncbi:spore germination protein [Cohnella cholangitidis]|uniref:Spore germination protein n=1 Tax=Cohnella cholangitidis TaxID=2598458 RepID=A0A7G5C3I8_9BACL|nr:spore germination protein [Cohnella cholangitidis]QMV43772.1 spore germination protein [Cohnella cholangitidis]